MVSSVSPLRLPPQLGTIPQWIVLLSWQAEETKRFERDVVELGPDALDAKSALPGWSRKHVVTHVARNADALVNLLTWGRTGVETPQYPDPETRSRDIEAGGDLPGEVVIEDMLTANERYSTAVGDFPDSALGTLVRTAHGREIAVDLVPWLRAREVCVHAIDLNTGTTFADLPTTICAALLYDALAGMAGKEGAPHLVGAPPVPGEWELGFRDADTRVRGTLPEITGYVLRGSIGSTLHTEDSTPPPDIPRWL
jgi:maleylpyruvate isomerase